MTEPHENAPQAPRLRGDPVGTTTMPGDRVLRSYLAYDDPTLTVEQRVAAALACGIELGQRLAAPDAEGVRQAFARGQRDGWYQADVVKALAQRPNPAHAWLAGWMRGFEDGYQARRSDEKHR